jgi:hypothetical protein
VNVEAIQELISVLDENRPYLDMSTYFGEDMFGVPTACAIGWGHTFNALPEGLVYDEEDEQFYFGNKIAFYAIAKAYNITLQEALNLFGGSQDRSLDEQISVMRDFINEA